MRAIAAAGLDTVYLWVCWGWVEPEPSVFEFGDYDRLIEQADSAGLQVVLNTVGEIQPFWIHHVVPECHLVNHRGMPIVSTTRVECNVGLTPGGCTDHPRVRQLMARFLDATAAHYSNAGNLIAWDLWNETRWAVQAEGHVCYCGHTVEAFREWLRDRYVDLSGLNQAWRRRYCSWDDVDPGRSPGHTYTELLEFQAFLTWRAAEHMRFRLASIRAQDPHRKIVAHAMSPASVNSQAYEEQALSRGNDWEYADFLDGFGASLFPAWFHGAGIDIGARVEGARSASQDKTYWVGELQGGSARGGIQVHPTVTAEMQQRWLWNVIGRGAKTVNFWCWRDEVFGRESSGFGIIGNDGAAEDRLRALAHTAAVVERHRELLDQYRPDPARIGVIFEPANYQLDWAEYGVQNHQAHWSVRGYLHAFERLQFPYDVIESGHSEPLSHCRFVVMPWPLIVNPDLAARLLEWVRDGGTLLVESELDAYDHVGFYRYPDERPFANALGIHSLGRRPVPQTTFPYELPNMSGRLRTAGWSEPLDSDGAEVLGAGPDGPLVIRRSLGSGQIIAVGGFLGLAHAEAREARQQNVAGSWQPGPTEREADVEQLETFLCALAHASSALPALRCVPGDGELVQWRSGRAGRERLLFVVNDGLPTRLTFSGTEDVFGEARIAYDLMTDLPLPIERRTADGSHAPCNSPATVTLEIDQEAYSVLVWTA